MGEARQHSRNKCYSFCLLMEQDGETFEGLMSDISLGGALVKVHGKPHLHVGDMFDMMMADKSTTFPVKRAAKVVRFGCDGMGVKFLTDLHHLSS